MITDWGGTLMPKNLSKWRWGRCKHICLSRQQKQAKVAGANFLLAGLKWFWDSYFRKKEKLRNRIFDVFSTSTQNFMSYSYVFHVENGILKNLFCSHLSVSKLLSNAAPCSDVLLRSGASRVIGSCFALIYIIRLSETRGGVSAFCLPCTHVHWS